MNVQEAVTLVVIGTIIGVCFYDVNNKVSSSIHDLKFRLERISVWLPMGFTYALFYCCRYNIAAGNNSETREKLGMSESDFSVVITAGFWTYAFSAPFTGYVADKLGGRRALLCSAALTGITNLAIGMVELEHTSFILFVILFALQILFQGLGTSAVVKINAGWYTQNERGLFSGIFNILLTSGYFMALGGCPKLIKSLGWPSVFFVPGCGMLFFTMVMFLTLKTTTSISPPPPPPLSPLSGESDEESGADEITPLQIEERTDETRERKGLEVFRELAKNKQFICYLAAIGCLCWVRDGLIAWIYPFLETHQPITGELTSAVSGAITLGGFTGGILCGWLSDILFKSNRHFPMIVFSVFEVVALTLLFNFADRGDLVVSVLVFLVSVFMLGNYTLLSYTIPTDLPAPIVSTAAGIMTAFGYLASGLAGVGMDSVIKNYGFRGWFLSLIIATLGMMFSIILGSLLKRAEQIEAFRRNLMIKKNTKIFSFMRIGNEMCVLKESDAPVVTMGGVQDEKLRLNWATNEFHQFEDRTSTSSERVRWKLSKFSPSLSVKKTNSFLDQRGQDPNSYFNNLKGKGSKRRTSPY